jgi:hypothetical protein
MSGVIMFKQFIFLSFSVFIFFFHTNEVQSSEHTPSWIKFEAPSFYPYTDPWTSTLTFALIRPKNLNFKSKQMTLHPERDRLPYIGKINLVRYGLFLAKDKSAPLIFIHPGAGGNGIEMGSTYLAEILQNKGFSVITLPSTFNFRFALSISRSGLPGHIQTDSEDLYLMMKTIYNQIYLKNNIKPKSVNLIGYSLGARDAAFVNILDQKEHLFNFNRIYFINPPLNTRQTMYTLDNLFNIGLRWDDKFRNNISVYVSGHLMKYIETPPTFEDYSNLDKNFIWHNKPFSTSVKQWLIGANYRKNLRELIYTSQIIKDLGIQKVPLTEEFKQKRYDEAMMFSFEKYLSLFILPQIKKQFGVEPDAYLQSVEFQPAAELAKQTATVAIVHNSNDFLLNENDTPWIENYSKDSKIFNYGGHLGALWVPENINHMTDFFKPLL